MAVRYEQRIKAYYQDLLERGKALLVGEQALAHLALWQLDS